MCVLIILIVHARMHARYWEGLKIFRAPLEIAFRGRVVSRWQTQNVLRKVSQLGALVRLHANGNTYSIGITLDPSTQVALGLVRPDLWAFFLSKDRIFIRVKAAKLLIIQIIELACLSANTSTYVRDYIFLNRADESCAGCQPICSRIWMKVV